MSKSSHWQKMLLILLSVCCLQLTACVEGEDFESSGTTDAALRVRVRGATDEFENGAFSNGRRRQFGRMDRHRNPIPSSEDFEIRNSRNSQESQDRAQYRFEKARRIRLENYLRTLRESCRNSRKIIRRQQKQLLEQIQRNLERRRRKERKMRQSALVFQGLVLNRPDDYPLNSLSKLYKAAKSDVDAMLVAHTQMRSTTASRCSPCVGSESSCSFTPRSSPAFSLDVLRTSSSSFGRCEASSFLTTPYSYSKDSDFEDDRMILNTFSTGDYEDLPVGDLPDNAESSRSRRSRSIAEGNNAVLRMFADFNITLPESVVRHQIIVDSPRRPSTARGSSTRSRSRSRLDSDSDRAVFATPQDTEDSDTFIVQLPDEGLSQEVRFTQCSSTGSACISASTQAGSCSQQFSKIPLVAYSEGASFHFVLADYPFCCSCG